MKIRIAVIGGLALLAMAVLLSCGERSLKPGEGYVDVPGGKVWYRIVGSGTKTPLLVLHGGPGVPSYYLKPLAALADDRPVIFYDQLGCGHSPAPNDSALWTIDRFVEGLASVRKALGLRKIDLYGHSWGSILATEYMLTKPSGVESVIMAGPAISIPRWVHDADSLLTTLPDSVQQVIRENEEAGTTDSPAYQDAVMVYYQKYLARKQPWSADIDSSFAQINPALYQYACGPSEFSITGFLRGYDRTGQLNQIKVPVLFIAGQYDEVTPSTMKYYQDLIPGSKLVIVPDAGHLAMQDDPVDYVNDLRTFLDSVDRE